MSCTRRRRWESLAVLTLMLTMAVASQAQTFNSLASFNGTDGGNPYYVYLVQGVNGQLYGTTYGYGANSYGTVFEITTGGTIKTLYNFCSQPSCTDGANPGGGLLLASDGNFYGTTTAGGVNGSGTVFKMTPAGVLTTLYSFCAQAGCADGSQPYVGLIQGSNGLLYGTASSGGAPYNGTIFSISTTGKFTLLHTFNGSSGDGAYPDARLVQGADGAFYGVTYQFSTAYKITAAGKFTVLHTFNGSTDGNGATGALFLASNGNFYGTTSAGGANSVGTVYAMTPAGKVTTLYNFCSLASCADGSQPWAGVIQATTGIFTAPLHSEEPLAVAVRSFNSLSPVP